MYKYGMRLRGFSLGCQPSEGFYERRDDLTGKYWDVLVYTRQLTEKELNDYDLDFIACDNTGHAPANRCILSAGGKKMATEAQKKATKKYDAANTIQFHLKLNRGTDADIIAALEAVASEPGGKQGYIKRLIRQDIRG